MRITRWLWGLWVAMILSMMMRRQADTYMIVALIVIPILIVLIDLHEEIATLKEENKHQRKFVMDRYNAILERMKDVSSQVEKRLVVDFAEFAKNNNASESVQNLPSGNNNPHKPVKKLKKRKRTEQGQQPPAAMDFSQAPKIENDNPAEPEDEFEDI